MEEQLEQLRLLKTRVRKTMEGYQTMLRDLNRLQMANQQLQVENQHLEEQVKQLEEEVKTAKLAQAINGKSDQDTREMKLQINNYLREIDKCLALLNRD